VARDGGLSFKFLGWRDPDIAAYAASSVCVYVCVCVLLALQSYKVYKERP